MKHSKKTVILVRAAYIGKEASLRVDHLHVLSASGMLTESRDFQTSHVHMYTLPTRCSHVFSCRVSRFALCFIRDRVRVCACVCVCAPVDVKYSVGNHVFPEGTKYAKARMCPRILMKLTRFLLAELPVYTHLGVTSMFDVRMYMCICTCACN